MITREGAMAVVFSPDRRQVLLLRREFIILWDFPGGGVEKGEDPADAAVREACEETGYDIELERPVGTYYHQSVYGRGDQRTYAFSARVSGGTPKRYGLETAGLKFFPLDALPRWLEPLHRQIIADALVEQAAPIERRIDFPRWKLYPARIVFFVARSVTFVLRRILRLFNKGEH